MKIWAPVQAQIVRVRSKILILKNDKAVIFIFFCSCGFEFNMKSKQKSAKLSLGNSSTKVKPVHKGKIKNIA